MAAYAVGLRNKHSKWESGKHLTQEVLELFPGPGYNVCLAYKRLHNEEKHNEPCRPIL